MLICIAVSANAQYQQQYDNQPRYQQYSETPRPQPVILMHKQALGQDGSFKYAFAADNGLQQGETINPDGTRIGSYSYVDPNGKKISVKYSAGKDGFKILEGDHVPKAPPLPAAAAPLPEYQGTVVPGPSPYKSVPSFTNHLLRGQESGPYYKVQDIIDKSAFKNVYQSAPSGSFQGLGQHRQHPVSAQPSAQYSSSAHFDDEDTNGPHSFGNGYAFEFAG
jgi:hypothetical protein